MCASYRGVSKDGSFEFRNLDPGLYDLIVTTETGSCGGVPALSPSLDADACVTVSLHEGTTVRVTRLGQDSQRGSLRAVQAGAAVAYGSVAPGVSTVLRVPPGRLVIELTALNARWEPIGDVQSREVVAVLGQEPEVLFP
jgi:hypothetical protein